MTAPALQTQDAARQLEKMAQHLRHSERSTLLIASTADAELERALADELARRLAGHALREFRFSPSQLSLPNFLRSLPAPDGQAMVFAYGLDDLPNGERRRAIEELNLSRETLRWAGYAVVLWLRPPSLTELTFQAPDFYAVRSGLFDFDLPADSAARAETLAALQLHGPATLDELRRRYLDYVIATCRWLDFRGLLQVRNLVRLKLEDIFVPLSAEKEERFYLIELKGVDEKGIQAERDIFRLAVEKQRVELDAALRENSRLVILGDPGSGKSTLLKYLALTFAEGGAQVRERLKLDESRLPILFPIAAYTLALREKPDLPLDDFLPAYFESLGLPNLAPLFEEVIREGKAIILLDGLDEVLDSETRSKVVRQVEALVAAHPRNRYVVSSRMAGYTSAALGPTFTTLTIRPFERREIETFARQWSRAYEALNVGRDAISPYLPPEAERRAEARAKSLTEAIFASPSVERLATTPLLLTLLALIHYQGTRLPSRRVELYRLCVEALAETWNLARSLSGQPIELWLGERRLDEREIVNVLAPVAFAMHQRQPGGLISCAELEAQVTRVLAERRGEPPDRARKLASDFVNLIREQVGLLLERGPDQFGFMHLTFEEYLAARYIASKREPFALVKPHLYDPRWREVILLTAASLEEKDATEFVRAIWSKDVSSYRPSPSAGILRSLKMMLGSIPLSEILQLNLFLAGRCLADEALVGLNLRRKIIDAIVEMVVRGSYSKLREEAAILLGSFRNTAYASEAVTWSLLVALWDGDATVRRNVGEVLGQLGQAPEEIRSALLVALKNRDENVDVRRSAAYGLGRIGQASETVVNALLATLKDKDENVEVRRSAVDALGWIGQVSETVVNALLATLKDKGENVGVRGSAADALGRIGQASETVVNALLATLKDKGENVGVRGSAADALGRIGQASETVVNALLATLKDKDEDVDVRISATYALGHLGQMSEAVVSVLLATLYEEDARLRGSATYALKALGRMSEEVVNALLTLMRDESAFVRWLATNVVGEVGQESKPVMSALLVALRDKDETVRRTAASFLGRRAQVSEVVVKMLLVALQDKDRFVRRIAARALGQLGQVSGEVVNALLTMMRDEDVSVRLSVALALVQLGQASEVVVSTLLGMLQHKSWGVRKEVAEALRELDVVPLEIVHALRERLKDEDTSVGDFAFTALWQLAPKYYEQGYKD